MRGITAVNCTKHSKDEPMNPNKEDKAKSILNVGVAVSSLPPGNTTQGCNAHEYEKSSKSFSLMLASSSCKKKSKLLTCHQDEQKKQQTVESWETCTSESPILSGILMTPHTNTLTLPASSAAQNNHSSQPPKHSLHQPASQPYTEAYNLAQRDKKHT